MNIHSPHALIKGVHSTYSLYGVAGRGGWGIIYKAKDIETGTEYALKMSRDKLTSQGLNDLYKELELVQRIQSSNVIQYVDYGYHNKRPVIIMELLTAQSLSSYVTQQGLHLSNEDKVQIICNLCDAIESIHSVNVIHCDIKPQNVIIFPDLSLKIVDFGLAKGLDHGLEIVNAQIGGTPYFMAPEQFQQNHYLSRSTDIYAIAMMTIWLLTSEPSWPKSGFSLLQWRIQNSESSPQNLHKLPVALQTILHSALSIDPEQRLSDVQRFKRRFLRAVSVNDPNGQVMLSPIPTLTHNSVTWEDSNFNTSFLFTKTLEDTYDAVETESTPAHHTTKILMINVSADQQSKSDLDHIHLGICEDLIDLLNISPEMDVVPFALCRDVKLAEVIFSPNIQWAQLIKLQKQFKIDYLLGQSIQFVDQNLMLRIDIFSLEDQLLVSRTEVTSPYDDVLNQLGGIAREVAQALKITLNMPTTQRAQLATTVDLLFRARGLAAETWHTDVAAAIKLYEQALELAPYDAIILAETARVKARASFIGHPPRRQCLEEAIPLAERAFELAPQHAQTLWALGYVKFYEGKREQALNYLDQALLFGGERSEIKDLIGRILTEEGPIERALAHLEQVLKNKSSMTTTIDLARLYAYLDQWDRVDELLNQEIKNNSDYGAREITRARLNLWRPAYYVPTQVRDREREGDLFSKLIDIFTELRRSQQFTTWHHEELLLLFHQAPRDSRLAGLYAQFIVECLAYCYGPKDPQVLEALERAYSVGVNDRLWIEFCPLL